MTSDLHVEHIIPTEYKKFSEWAHVDESNFEKFGNSIGNLTLLSGAKNIEASNNPFNVKLDVYKGIGKYKNKRTGLTGFEITKRIVQEHSLKDGIPEWTIDDTKNRWNWFCDEFSFIFDFEIQNLKIK
jgi:hypothetical protein